MRDQAGTRLTSLSDRREQPRYFFPQVCDRLAVAGQMPQQASLEEPIKQRIKRRPGDDGMPAAQCGKARRDAPHHILQALVDLGNVVAKGFFEQRLRAILDASPGVPARRDMARQGNYPSSSSRKRASTL